tara:strand:- start:1623 stop:1967 length:345 start_codon:yes stop_codon:yes gene_type:complete
MENLATKNLPIFSYELDFDNQIGSCLYTTENGVKIIIDFIFDIEIKNLSHDKGDYYTPECTTYDVITNVRDFEGYYFSDDSEYKVSIQDDIIISNYVEEQVKDYIQENELYNDY